MSANSIKVVARFRPQNRIELESGGKPIVTFSSEDSCSLDSKEAQGGFTFDRVFDMACKQQDIFDFSIRPTVDDILNGYNGTVFAYGQTGAGKSYTMMGTNIDDDDGRGVIPRIVEQIFASIMSSPSTIEYTVRVSYMEIYMERIRDLLAPQNDNLPVHEEKNRGVYVKGLLEIYVSSVQEVYEVMRRGGNARAVAATNMNQDRTTLIINCSPSSYNDAETLSTLRFGTRAKSIKNKAKVNAELSPAELKLLLKKAQGQVTNFENYISTLEGEVQLWRSGESVPKDKWAQPGDGIVGARTEPRTPRPSTPSRLTAESRAETPAATDRASTPSLALEKDEREEFLRRENELQDQLAEKESQVTLAEKTLRDTKEEMTYLKEHDSRLGKENERLTTETNEFKMQLERLTDNERSISEAIQHIEKLHEISSVGNNIAPDEFRDLRTKLVETQGIVRQAELSMFGSSSGEMDSRRRHELEERLEAMQQQYEDLLTKNLSESDVEEVKARLEHAYANRQTTQVELIDELKADAAQKAAENSRMKTLIEDLQQQVKAGSGATPVTNGKTIQQQIAEFDVMKKSLMRDLQNRCERVVELEISLDETREQYNNVLRSSNNRAQQKKMAFLERNLEQLTQVQRQLVEQNSALKKEVAIAERKLIARNERIQSLESLLQDSQEKMAAANHKFEVQLASVKERLEAAKAGSTKGLNATTGGFSFSAAGSRIAKPLRGGGGDGPNVPTIQSLQNEGATNKRSSWFFNKS
ncbi:Kinesin heavy chain [Metarhizium anisopliae]|nr:Kinesin heavy chain [Metarhizium anisopliae]